jgi:hypothetical protein
MVGDADRGVLLSFGHAGITGGAGHCIGTVIVTAALWPILVFELLEQLPSTTQPWPRSLKLSREACERHLRH